MADCILDRYPLHSKELNFSWPVMVREEDKIRNMDRQYFGM